MQEGPGEPVRGFQSRVRGRSALQNRTSYPLYPSLSSSQASVLYFPVSTDGAKA
jgi:hypothetical protein